MAKTPDLTPDRVMLLEFTLFANMIVCRQELARHRCDRVSEALTVMASMFKAYADHDLARAEQARDLCTTIVARWNEENEARRS